jgi:hypothetical protein
MERNRPPSVAATVALCVGPLLSVMVLAAQVPNWPLSYVAAGMWVAVAAWTPFAPFTFAAILLGDQRDRFTPPLGRVERSLLLIPWLALSPRSSARAATVLNLAGCIAAAVYTMQFSAPDAALFP